MDKNKFNLEITKLLDEQIKSINNIKNTIYDELYLAFNLILNSNNKVVFSGVGKSGHIGKKAAASFSSTGTPSIYLEPLDAAHGDLGMVPGCEIAILISNSGNSEELLNIIPTLKKIGIKIISITSNNNSKLAKMSDLHINTQVKNEICPLNLAPTTSTTITLIILDILMVLLMKTKNFKKENFALFHPAGTLGKQLLMTVEDLYFKTNLFIKEKDSIIEIIHTMSKIGKGIVPVLDEKNIVGVITDGDLRRNFEIYQHKIFTIKAKDILTKNPMLMKSNTLAIEALKIMEEKKITSLPVIDENNKYLGIIQIHDILKEGLKIE